jgi:hypothetical protein
MSSITFPNHSTPTLGSSQHEDPYYSPNGFEASSSFQMNPLSSHPPRTPKTSIISNASTIGGHEDTSEKVEIDEHDFDDEEERVKEAEKKLVKEDIWKEIILTSNGRDKAFVGPLVSFIVP